MMKLALLLSLAASSSAFLLSPPPVLARSVSLAKAGHGLAATSARIRPALRSGRGAATLLRAQGAATEGAVTEKGTVGIIGVTGGVGRLTAAAVLAQGFQVKTSRTPPACERFVSDAWRTNNVVARCIM